MQELQAPRGGALQCRGWEQEGILRLLLNTADAAVARDPERMVVYGSGKVARDPRSLARIAAALRELENDETLVVQSGKPVAVFRTHPEAPRVVMSVGMLVPAWARSDIFWELERRGLTLYGQTTAACWAYVGAQGILQGTYETFAAVARRHFGGSLRGRLVLTAGLGQMGQAQPAAVTMNGGVCLAVEVDAGRLRELVERNELDLATADLHQAVAWALQAAREGAPRAIGLEGNAAEVYPALLGMGVVPDVVTDQTGAHEPLLGYVPPGIAAEEAPRLRARDPAGYVARCLEGIARQVEAMLEFQRRGAVVFDYGNNIRQQALRAGVSAALSIPGFVEAYIRPLLCEGRGPFRWIALSGEPRDIFHLDEMLLEVLPPESPEARWIRTAQRRLWFQGLPARVLWLDAATRVRFGEMVWHAVARERVAAPIALTRDHLDAGAMASPRRETEGMPDGSDAIADWPVLNALLNAAAGATLVSLQHGGGVGIGYSIHAGMTLIVDGRPSTLARVQRVLRADVGLGLCRLYDAGYAKPRPYLDSLGIRLAMEPEPAVPVSPAATCPPDGAGVSPAADGAGAAGGAAGGGGP